MFTSSLYLFGNALIMLKTPEERENVVQFSWCDIFEYINFKYSRRITHSNYHEHVEIQVVIFSYIFRSRNGRLKIKPVVVTFTGAIEVSVQFMVESESMAKQWWKWQPKVRLDRFSAAPTNTRKISIRFSEDRDYTFQK